MKIFKLFCFLFLLSSISYSQTFFSSVPDFGGDEMEGRTYNVIPS